MINTNWSKTILGSYKYLERMSDAIDKMVKAKAFNSFYASNSSNGLGDVMSISTSILNLTERKITLVNLKILTEKALKSMDNTLARILILKFIDCKKSEEIAERFGFCLRTYFRKVNEGLESFYKALTRLGYCELKLKNILKNENWILDLFSSYQNVEKSKIDNILESKDFQNKFKKSIILDLKRLSAC